jgi:hypothetical protein
MKGNMRHLNGDVGAPISKLRGTGMLATGFWSRTECLSMADRLVWNSMSAEGRTTKE